MFDVFSRLAIALGLGLLVGLQRERTDARLAGFRTFPLVALLGAMSALLAEEFGGGVIIGAFLALGIVILAGNLPLLRGTERPGVTSEIAMLVVFAVGAYLMAGSTAVAIVICGAVAVLLHLKPQMHSLAEGLADRDFTAIMQFALISLVILPVLPNRPYGPFDVLNPFKLWLMVVLIVGISLGGYVAYKLVGVRAGAWANGIFGGLISSTATAVSVARRSKEAIVEPGLSAFVILIASAVVFARVALLLAVTAPSLLQAAWLALLTMLVVLAGFGWASLPPRETGNLGLPRQANPTELKPALLFGALYAAVLFSAAAARQWAGSEGLYGVALVSGLTDMDAITLSVGQLSGRAEIPPEAGTRLLVTAAAANLVFKGIALAVLGDRRVAARVAAGFLAAGLAGAAVAWLAPV